MLHPINMQSHNPFPSAFQDHPPPRSLSPPLSGIGYSSPSAYAIPLVSRCNSDEEGIRKLPPVNPDWRSAVRRHRLLHTHELPLSNTSSTKTPKFPTLAHRRSEPQLRYRSTSSNYGGASYRSPLTPSSPSLYTSNWDHSLLYRQSHSQKQQLPLPPPPTASLSPSPIPNTPPLQARYNSQVQSLPQQPVLTLSQKQNLPLQTTTNVKLGLQHPSQCTMSSNLTGRIQKEARVTWWDEENILCYEVEVNGVPVLRRSDNNYVNATKLLNSTLMTRGRRDGILKGEMTKLIVRSGPMKFIGIWIPLDNAIQMARREGVQESLYPLFERDIGKIN